MFFSENKTGSWIKLCFKKGSRTHFLKMSYLLFFMPYYFFFFINFHQSTFLFPNCIQAQVSTLIYIVMYDCFKEIWFSLTFGTLIKTKGFLIFPSFFFFFPAKYVWKFRCYTGENIFSRIAALKIKLFSPTKTFQIFDFKIF